MLGPHPDHPDTRLVLVQLNGHTSRLVDVSATPDYPGEWRTPLHMSAADMEAINRVWSSEEWDLSNCPSRLSASRNDYEVARWHGCIPPHCTYDDALDRQARCQEQR